MHCLKVMRAVTKNKIFLHDLISIERGFEQKRVGRALNQKSSNSRLDTSKQLWAPSRLESSSLVLNKIRASKNKRIKKDRSHFLIKSLSIRQKWKNPILSKWKNSKRENRDILVRKKGNSKIESGSERGLKAF